MAEDHDAGSVSVQPLSTQAVHATILVAESNTNIEPQRRLAADGILGNPKAPPRNSGGDDYRISYACKLSVSVSLHAAADAAGDNAQLRVTGHEESGLSPPGAAAGAPGRAQAPSALAGRSPLARLLPVLWPRGMNLLLGRYLVDR